MGGGIQIPFTFHRNTRQNDVKSKVVKKGIQAFFLLHSLVVVCELLHFQTAVCPPEPADLLFLLMS